MDTCRKDFTLRRKPKSHFVLGPTLHVGDDLHFVFGDGSNCRGRFRLQGYFVDGSFVTAKPEPNDVDAVVWLPDDFTQCVSNNNLEAMELETMLLTRHPEEIFAAEDRRDWDDWLEFFSRTRESDGRRKGVVEIEL